MATRDFIPDDIAYSSRVKKVQVLAPNGSPVSSTNPLPTSSSTSFATNDIDEASATVTYIGMEDGAGVWYVKKIDTTTGNSFGHATITNNTTVADYSAAWTARATLTYEDYSEAF